MEVPLRAIRRALQSRPDVLHQIHHRKMEELVASVMSEFFVNAEVTVCGKSHDGGIDVILVMANTSIAIQVKRRTRPDCVEPVAPIREFLGACLLRGFKQCLYVTSAQHFSRMAIQEAEQAVAMQLVQRFELIEKERLLALLKSVQSRSGSMTQREV